MNETIRGLIAAADEAIKEERFDDLMEFYTDDAVLVVRPSISKIALFLRRGKCL